MKIKLRSSLLILLGVLCLTSCTQQTIPEHIDSKVNVLSDTYQQTVWGIGFEIQSDAIGSGNTGLPKDKHAVPHDLTETERIRFAEEMLSGFRYCRIAGGLYWRGLDAEQKYMQPRWPEQLQEIKQMMERAGVEGVSLEYWSPAPYWKANGSYLGEKGKQKYNTLRCFGPDFNDDPIYNGDTLAFLKDFSEACVKDIQTLEEAGIAVSMWGMQNEPFVTNNKQYSTCKYYKAEDYIKAYIASASAIRAYDSEILLLSDTETGYPKKIAKGMHREEVAAVVDAYAVHTIGWDSERVKAVDKKIKETLPQRPWFQNEYEYLSGGATPERCLNTVQHIMNSFQLGENPTWFWIHALKPFKNSEASGYSLGFWRSMLEEHAPKDINTYRRWVKGPVLTAIPEAFMDMEYINVLRPTNKEPGRSFSFSVNQDVEAYMIVEQFGAYVPEGWDLTDLSIAREGAKDLVYMKTLKEGKHSLASHSGKEGEFYGAPHALFLDASEKENLKVDVGVNSPIRIRSEAMKLELAAAEMEPGTWIYNDFNWNAVGSFVKRIPWDSRVLTIEEENYNEDARVFVYEKPNGKKTVVLSNRTGADYSFELVLGEKSRWKGYQYSPWERGEGTMGIEIGKQRGEALYSTLEHLSWEFWEEQ